MGLFPYPPRPFQAEAIGLVDAIAREGGHLVLEAPTGSGKTAILLAGTLEAAASTGKRILYLTRTNSQQAQAVRELAAIRTHSGRPFRGLALQGRHQVCLKLEDDSDPELEESTAEELSLYCTQAKRLAETEPTAEKACRYYAGLLRRNEEELATLLGDEPRTAEDLKSLGRLHGFCGYEATKRLLPQADVVIAPYVFGFDPALRARLFDWWKVPPDQVILIVDEAHNLPEYLRELHSPRLGKETLRRALAESARLHHPALSPSLSAHALLEGLAEVLDAVVAEYCKEEDGFLPPFEVEAALLSRFRLTTSSLLRAADQLAQLGEIIREERRRAGRVPKSALSRVATFLRHWFQSDEEGYVKLAVRLPRPYLEAYLVDASRAATDLALFHATIHASGTLAPLTEYRDALGLAPETRLERVPSPFPPDRLVIVATKGLTTRYERLRTDPGLVDRLQDATRRFLLSTRVSVAVFFPSHQLLRDFQEVGVLEAPGRQVLVERAEAAQEALMGLVARHRSRPGDSVLVGVLGGRLSEGLDFPGRQLEAVLVVGAPYPKPTARQRSLFRYFEARYGRGWDYAVKAPALRRLRQSMGRLIRSETDRGFALVLDERAAPLLREVGLDVAEVEPADALDAFDRWQATATAQPAVRYD